MRKRFIICEVLFKRFKNSAEYHHGIGIFHLDEKEKIDFKSTVTATIIPFDFLLRTDTPIIFSASDLYNVIMYDERHGNKIELSTTVDLNKSQAASHELDKLLGDD